MLIIAGFSTSSFALAECSDFEAKLAADKLSQDYIDGKIFKPALILKKHLPSQRKEVASYTKKDDLYYTVYSLVNSKCTAQVIKRTNGKH